MEQRDKHLFGLNFQNVVDVIKDLRNRSLHLNGFFNNSKKLPKLMSSNCSSHHQILFCALQGFTLYSLIYTAKCADNTLVFFFLCTFSNDWQSEGINETDGQMHGFHVKTRIAASLHQPFIMFASRSEVAGKKCSYLSIKILCSTLFSNGLRLDYCNYFPISLKV